LGDDRTVDVLIKYLEKDHSTKNQYGSPNYFCGDNKDIVRVILGQDLHCVAPFPKEVVYPGAINQARKKLPTNSLYSAPSGVESESRCIVKYAVTSVAPQGKFPIRWFFGG
jgi:hypothetical protein